MKFALLYSYDPARAGPAEGEVDDWLALDAEIRGSGVFVYESGFQPASTARTVSARDGQARRTVGRRSPATSWPACLYVVDVADADEAAE